MAEGQVYSISCEAERRVFRERNVGINTGADDVTERLPRWSFVFVTLLTAVESDDNS